jgi:hypothetical protein
MQSARFNADQRAPEVRRGAQARRRACQAASDLVQQLNETHHLLQQNSADTEGKPHP